MSVYVLLGKFSQRNLKAVFAGNFYTDLCALKVRDGSELLSCSHPSSMHHSDLIHMSFTCHSHVSFLIRAVFGVGDAASDCEDDHHGEHLDPARDYKNSEELTFDAQNAVFPRLKRYWVVEIVSRADFTTM